MLGSVYLFLGGCGGGVGWCLKGEGRITFSGDWGRVKIINSAVFGEGHIKNIQSDSTFGVSRAIFVLKIVFASIISKI